MNSLSIVVNRPLVVWLFTKGVESHNKDYRCGVFLELFMCSCVMFI